MHLLLAGLRQPRQIRTKGLASHSSPIVVGSRWPGWTRVSGGSSISRITEVSQVVEAAGARRHRAADRSLEEDVGGEEVGAVDEEGEVAGGVAGGEDRLDLEAAGGELLAVGDRLGDVIVHLRRRLGVGDQRRAAELLARLGQARDVVADGGG